MSASSDQMDLQSAAARLENDPFFMAALLAEYRFQMRSDDQQLAKTLRCTVQALTKLALCRAPRLDDAKSFLADVQAIAKYAGCDWEELAKLVRTAQAFATLKRFAGLPENQLLKAARDKPRKKPDKPAKPRKR
jgi:hypothetical protein